MALKDFTPKDTGEDATTTAKEEQNKNLKENSTMALKDFTPKDTVEDELEAAATDATIVTATDAGDLNDLMGAAKTAGTTSEFSGDTSETPDETTTAKKEKKELSPERKFTKSIQAATSSILAAQKDEREGTVLVRCKKEISDRSEIVGYVCENGSKVDLTLAKNKEKSTDITTAYDYVWKSAGPSAIKVFAVKTPIDLINKLNSIRESQNKGDIPVESIKKAATSQAYEIKLLSKEDTERFLKANSYNYLKESPALFVPMIKTTKKNDIVSVSETKSITSPDNNPAFVHTGGKPGMYMKAFQQGRQKGTGKSAIRYDELNMNIKNLDRESVINQLNNTIEIKTKLVNTGRTRGTGCSIVNGELFENYIPMNGFETLDPGIDFNALTEADKRKYTKAYFGRFPENKLAGLTQASKALLPEAVGGKYPISPAFNGDEASKKYWNGVSVPHYYLKNADGSPVMMKVGGTGVQKLAVVKREARIKGGAEITDFSAEGSLKGASSVTVKQSMTATSAVAGGYSWDSVDPTLRALLGSEFDGAKFIGEYGKVSSAKGASTFSSRSLKTELDPALYAMLESEDFINYTADAILAFRAK